MEWMWKTGRNWRRFKAWRVAAVVQYLKLEGDVSVLDPAIDVLTTQSWEAVATSDRGSEYPPRMERAPAELEDQMAPYRPVELILTFGDESTLTQLRNLTARPETADTLKRVLNTTISLLEQRLEAKRLGQPVEKVGPHDLYAEIGDASTLENMRKFWGHATGPYAEKFHRDMAKLEKRLQEQEKAGKPD
jgi:hypothetical protein